VCSVRDTLPVGFNACFLMGVLRNQESETSFFTALKKCVDKTIDCDIHISVHQRARRGRHCQKSNQLSVTGNQSTKQTRKVETRPEQSRRGSRQKVEEKERSNRCNLAV